MFVLNVLVSGCLRVGLFSCGLFKVDTRLNHDGMTKLSNVTRLIGILK